MAPSSTMNGDRFVADVRRSRFSNRIVAGAITMNEILSFTFLPERTSVVSASAGWMKNMSCDAL